MATIIQPQTASQQVADHLVGVQTAAQVVGLADHKRLLDNHARTLRLGQLLQARALGAEDLMEKLGDDMAGDVNVSGDHITYQVAPPPPSQPNAATVAPKTGWAATAAKLAAAAALGAGGLGAAQWAIGKANAPPAATVDPQPPAVEYDPSRYRLGLSAE